MVQLTEELIPTRTTLLQRLKDWQDQSSWQEFFDTYWKLIFGVAIKSGLSEAEAQDVVQETLICVARHMPSFKYDRENGSFKAWLLKMTRWRISDQFRNRKNVVEHSHYSGTFTVTQSDEVVDQAAKTIEAIWDTEWENNLLDAAVGRVKRRLDPEKFQIFDFYVNKEWSPDRVAETFGIPVSQVYLAKHRIIAMIKGEVERLRIETI